MCLTIGDDATHEAVAIEVERAISGHGVVRVMERLDRRIQERLESMQPQPLNHAIPEAEDAFASDSTAATPPAPPGDSDA
jgi:demethoxyubiquinone hydroxylase (CLK1/Coq7/Cat5 family)